jgi:hypothetical protein
MSTDKHGRQSPDQAADGGSARYGKPSGSRGSGGHQESGKPERKEARGFVSRQGGDQTNDGQARPDDGRRPDDDR